MTAALLSLSTRAELEAIREGSLQMVERINRILGGANRMSAKEVMRALELKGSDQIQIVWLEQQHLLTRYDRDQKSFEYDEQQVQEIIRRRDLPKGHPDRIEIPSVRRARQLMAKEE